MNPLPPTLALNEAARRAWDVAVVGAGPAGGAAARAIAAAGASVLLIDKARHPRPKVCGCCLNARSLDALARLGILDRIRREGAMPQAELLLAAGNSRATLRLESSFAFSRAALDAALIASAVEAGAGFLPETPARLETDAEGRHSIALVREGRTAVIRPGAIVAADGLGGGFARKALGGETIRPSSRIGAGAQAAEADGYPEGRLTMAVGRGGYVGLARIENGLLNLGAALAPEAVRKAGGIASAVEGILRECGLPPVPGLAWHGTPPLTRRPRTVAARALFAVGDAAGYIEPFTGEGIAWALDAGCAVAPLAIVAAEGRSPDSASEWMRIHHRLVRRRQGACRAVSALARAPRLARIVVAMLGALPVLADPLLDFLNASAVDGAAPEFRP